MRWLALAILALAGCTAPAGDALMPQWSAHACDPTSARPSGNAPVRPPFHADLDTLIARLEDALEVDLPGPPARVDDVWRYDLQDGGTLTVSLGDGGPLVSWVHPTLWPGPGDGHAAMEAALRELGAWGPEVRITGQAGNLEARQAMLGGGWMAGALWHPDHYSEPGWSSSFDLRPGYDLTGSRGPADDAQPVAQAFVDCLGRGELPGDWTIQAQPHLSVQHQSLAWTFLARGAADAEHHCGGPAIHVHVDADTGAVHGWESAACD